MSSAAETRTSTGNRIGVGRRFVAGPELAHRVGEVLDGQAVLHLDEAHLARRAEHLVAAIDHVALGGGADHELGHGGRRPREAPADATDHGQPEVLAEPLVADVAGAGLRARRLVGADVALHLAALAAARHPVQLEVVDGGGLVEQPVEDVVERLDGLAGVQHERRHALQRDLGDDAQRADADPGHPQQLGVRRGVDAHDVAGAGDELHPDDRRRQVAEPEPGAVGGGGDGTGDRLAVDVAEVRHRQPGRGEGVVEPVEADAGLHPDPPGVAGRRRARGPCGRATAARRTSRRRR